MRVSLATSLVTASLSDLRMWQRTPKPWYCTIILEHVMSIIVCNPSTFQLLTTISSYCKNGNERYTNYQSFPQQSVMILTVSTVNLSHTDTNSIQYKVQPRMVRLFAETDRSMACIFIVVCLHFQCVALFKSNPNEES